MYDGWAVINVYLNSHVQYLSIGSHFTHFYCIGRRFGALRVVLERVIIDCMLKSYLGSVCSAKVALGWTRTLKCDF